jgi:mRNA interferase RelE/StbE
MPEPFAILYHELVVREDIAKLPKAWRARIKQAIETRLTSQPDLYGKPLRRSLKGYRKLRVGDYRVIFRIEEQGVYIFSIQHRKQVY